MEALVSQDTACKMVGVLILRAINEINNCSNNSIINIMVEIESFYGCDFVTYYGSNSELWLEIDLFRA